jgi:hypothetical protein
MNTVLLQHRLRLGNRIDDQASQHVRSDRVEAQLEARDDADFAAAAAQLPEEVRVIAGAGAYQVAGRRHDLGGLQIVHRHAELAAEPAEASSDAASLAGSDDRGAWRGAPSRTLPLDGCDYRVR